MRKLKLQVQLTVDGYMAGPNGEMDWMIHAWTDDLNRYVQSITAPVDTIVLGRKLAEGFIPYWQSVAANPDDPQQEAGKVFTDTRKVVFSRTLEQAPWNNTTLAKAGLAEAITQLKEEAGKDIIAYGGAAFVSELIRHRLVDAFYLFVNPVLIGKGLPVFPEGGSKQELQLVASQAFDCGIIVLHYEPVQS